MKHLVLFNLYLAMLVLSLPLMAQEEDEAGKKLTITGAYAAIGSTTRNEYPQRFTTDQINRLGLSGVIEHLKAAPSQQHSFHSNPSSVSFFAEPVMFVNMGVDLKTIPEGNSSVRMRAGITFSNQNMRYLQVFKKEDLLGRSIRDTMVYLNRKDTVFLYQDSVSGKVRQLNYTNQILALDFSVVAETNPEKRLSFFGGMGISPGMVINAMTRVIGEDYAYSGFGDTYKNETTSYFEKVKNKPGFFVHVYAPLGISYRLSKTQEILKHLYFFGEIRPGLMIQGVPEIGTSLEAGIMQFMGLRAAF